MDTPERRAKLRQSVANLLKMIDGGVPDVLIARECVTVFRHSLVTFEQLAADIFSSWLVRSVRVNCGQCVDCGAKLPSHRVGPPTCGSCQAAVDVDILSQDLAKGVDAIDFDKHNTTL